MTQRDSRLIEITFFKEKNQMRKRRPRKIKWLIQITQLINGRVEARAYFV